MKEAYKQRIEELYLEMHDKLIIYARCALKNESLAEEAVQEAFHIACQKPEKLCNSPNPQGWLMLTLRNTIQNMRRSQTAAKNLMEKYLQKQPGALVFSEDAVNLRILYDSLADKNMLCPSGNTADILILVRNGVYSHFRQYLAASWLYSLF